MFKSLSALFLVCALSVGCGATLSPERQATIKLTQAVELGKRVRVTTQSFEKAAIIHPNDAKTVYGHLLTAQTVAQDVLTSLETVELLGTSPELVDKINAGFDVLVLLYPAAVKDVPTLEVKSKLLVILNQSQSLVKDAKEVFNGR